MSLLMDALKKAELAKRQSSGEADAPTVSDLGELSLEPIAPAAPAPATEPAVVRVAGAQATPAATTGEAAGSRPAERLPPLPQHLETLEQEFLGDKAPPPRRTATAAAATADRPERGGRAPAAADAGRAAAENLFVAKQPAANAPRRGFLIGVGVLTVLAAAGIGGYFWWQLQPRSGLLPAGSTPLPTRPLAPPPMPAPPPVAPAAPPVATLPPPLPTPATAPPTTVAAKPDATPGLRNDPAPASDAPKKRGSAASDRRAAGDGEGPIRVTKTPPRTQPQVTMAYEAFNRGDLAAAQLAYDRVLRSEPRNVDALHGMAAIAVRQNRTDQAELYYQRVLEADPQDAAALAALLNLRGQGDAVQTESRLKSLIATQPDLAEPHFALGNLYAQRGRWSDAQQAYFRAYNVEPDNPDILFNLAISLEHLRQNRLAAQYYAMAASVAKTRPAGFDPAQATARARKLAP